MRVIADSYSRSRASCDEYRSTSRSVSKSTPAGTHELDRAVNVGGQRLVARVGRVRHETLIPAVHLAQVGVTALREGTDKVQGRSRVVVQRQKTLRVGFACSGVNSKEFTASPR